MVGRELKRTRTDFRKRLAAKKQAKHRKQRTLLKKTTGPRKTRTYGNYRMPGKGHPFGPGLDIQQANSDYVVLPTTHGVGVALHAGSIHPKFWVSVTCVLVISM